MSQTYEYPWHRCAAGESFFIPTLHPAHVACEGMRLSRQYVKKGGASYRIGVYNGMLGVLFTVKRRPVPRSARSGDTPQGTDSPEPVEPV